MDFPSVLKKLVTDSGLSESEVLKLIEKKKDELGNLVSDMGAAHIVASDLGIKTLPQLRPKNKTNQLQDGQNSVDIDLKVLRVFPTRDWTKGEKSGKVASLVVSDETGTTRLTLWGDQTKLAAELKEGDILSVTGAYVRNDNQGRPELRAGARTKISINPVGVTIGAAAAPARSKISELKEGTTTIRAALLKVFDREPFYSVCSVCGRSVTKQPCVNHPTAAAAPALIINTLFDDGTGTIRAVFFKEVAEKVLGLTTAVAKQIADATNSSAVLAAANKNLGHEFLVTGRVKTSAFSGELEMAVNELSTPDPVSEANLIAAS